MDLKQVLDLSPRTLHGLNQDINDDSLVDIEQSKQIFDLFDKVQSDEDDFLLSPLRTETGEFPPRSWGLP